MPEELEDLNEDVVVLVGPDEPQDVGMVEFLEKLELLPRLELVEGPRTAQDFDGHALHLRMTAEQKSL